MPTTPNDSIRPLRKHRRGHLALRTKAPTVNRTAIGYVRISVDRENETSTETQEAAIRAWCIAHGVDLLRVVVDEGKSAYAGKAKRPKFDGVIRDLRNGVANTFVVWKVDRMIRFAAEFHAVRAKLRDCGASLVSTSEGVDTNDAANMANEIILNIYATIAEMESTNKSDRALVWNAQRFDNRLPPCGPRPYGYTRTDAKGNATPNTMRVVEDEAHALQRVANDIINKGGSIRGWCNRLNAEGIGTTNGKAWHPVVLKRILISPTTAGLIPLEDGGYVKGNWPGIFNRKQHDALVATLADPRRNRMHGNSRRYLATGIAFCECGRTLNTRPVNGKHRYACLDCGASIDGATLDSAIELFITKNVDRNAWQALRTQGRTTAPEVIAQHEAELRRIAEMQAAGSITLDQFEIMQRGAMTRLTSAAQGDALNLPNVDDLAKAWPSMALDAKRMALMAVTKRITVNSFGGPASRGLARIHII